MGLASNFTISGVTDAAGLAAGFQTNSIVANFTVTPSAVPEPSSLAALSVVGIAGVVRRRRKQRQHAEDKE